MLSIYDISMRINSDMCGDYMNSFLITYSVLLAKTRIKNKSSSFTELVENSKIDEGRRINLLSTLGQDVDMNALFEIADSTSEEDLKQALLNTENMDGRLGVDYGTPTCIVELANGILDLNKSKTVADFGSGFGTYIVQSYEKNPKPKYYGIDIACTINEIARIRAELAGVEAVFENGELFNVVDGIKKYDSIFSNYPWMFRNMEERLIGNPIIKKIVESTDNILRPHASDWTYNALIIGSLNKNGKGIGIMTNGSTWNASCKATRKYFVDNGLVEAIISLPERLFANTAIGSTMIVLSHGNKDIMMVDARKKFVPGRRTNTFSVENINEIVASYKDSSNFSKKVSVSEIASNDYSLNPESYLLEKITFENGTAFGTVIKNITRGAQISASDLDKITSMEKTDYQYLMLANIRDGIIDESLPYIKEIDKKLEKYCLKNNCLIMSKNGLPIKIAIAHIPEGKKILANGNLYVIELDESKVNPVYVKAFFESEIGSQILKRITVGATIPNIPVEALKEVEIPLLSKKEMDEITTLYLAKQDEVQLYKNKLDKAIDDLKHVFNF